MRIAIVGGTGHNHYLLEAIERRGYRDQLLAYAPGTRDEDLSALETMFARRNLTPERCQDWRVMLDRIKPDMVCVQPWMCDIAPITAGALDRGLAVFSEKPLAVDWDQWDLVRRAARQNAKLCAMFGTRGNAAFISARDAADQLGDIRLAYGQKSYKMGERGSVYQRRRFYGGLMPWVGIHALDWIYWMTGRRFLTAFSLHSQAGNRANGELETTAAALLEMERGTIATVCADYLRPSAAQRHDDDQLRLTGTRATLFVRNNEAYLECSDAAIQRLTSQGERSLCADFMAQLEGAGHCGLTAWDALHVTAAALAAREAADTHQPVAVPEGDSQMR
ncbi:MAG: Gfo/Idh/MocA family oxidoreductase [Oscillospiraceae bacterium]|jgi:predicted dehydrogenase|nr:Gfo/Idh/MocA family oxidoreductase [Oscillospiraceae bacterium]